MYKLLVRVSFCLALIPVTSALAAPNDGHKTTEGKAAAAPAKGAAILDGKEFSGEIVKEGEKSGDADSLVFKDGKFLSTACEEYGFGETKYSSTDTGGKTTFHAEVTNNEGAKMTWDGVIEGGKATATGKWSQNGEKSETYKFTGTQKG